MTLGDEQYQHIIDQVLQHDLTGYDVYLMGSITRGAAKDLDVAIVGEWDYERLAAIFEPLSAVSALDLYYQAVPPIAYDASMQPQGFRSIQWIGLDAHPAKKRGQLLGGFVVRTFTVPNGKAKTLKHKLAEPILLIQNGEQIYF